MILEEFALPEGEEAEYLLAGLARLIELRGLAPFVSAPILLPEPRFFPDRVGTRANGAATLLRRLLAYAGLEPRGVDVEIFGEENSGLVQKQAQDRHAAAWFIDIAEGVYRFGIRESELRDERALIGILGHEVAHAYRSHHRLVVRDRETEEKLTDLTTVFLGFGVFTLETSFTFRSGHYGASGQRLLYERNMRGYLLPGQLAFLLAAQLASRNARKNELKSTVSALSPNQADAVQRAFLLFQEEPDALGHSLRLPPLAEWPAPITLEDSLRELSSAKVRVHDARSEGKSARKERKIAFRVDGNRRIPVASAGFLLGALSTLELGPSSWFWPASLGLAFLGSAIGKALDAPSCSSCNRAIRRADDVCRSCNAELVGDIEHNNDRLDAEERYFEKLHASAQSSRGPADA